MSNTRNNNNNNSYNETKKRATKVSSKEDEPTSPKIFLSITFGILFILSLIFGKAGSFSSSSSSSLSLNVADDANQMSSVDDDAPDVGLTSYEEQHVDPSEVAKEPIEESLAKDDGEEHSDLDGDLDYHLDQPVQKPKTEVDNCKKCKKVTVPEMCGYAPKRTMEDLSVTMKKRRILSFDLEESEEEEDSDDDEAKSSNILNITTRIGLRKLLKGHQAFQTDRNRALAKSRQPDFKPPPESVREEVLKHYKMWQSDSACTMWTRTCVKRHLEGDDMGFKRGPEQYFKDKKMPGLDGSLVFPDLKRGELGTCALVAVADNMLGKGRGPEIDNHDTVFRYNGPLKAYKKDIGVKGDVYYWKQRRDEKQYGVEGQKANKYYMWKDAAKYWMFGDKKEFSKLTFRGKQLLWETPMASEMVGNVYAKYHDELNIKTKHASTGGFKLAMSVLASGLCTRLDLYGFSSKGGGRYFKNAVVNTVHLIGLEHYALRVAMEENYGVCVYD